MMRHSAMSEVTEHTRRIHTTTALQEQQQQDHYQGTVLALAQKDPLTAVSNVLDFVPRRSVLSFPP